MAEVKEVFQKINKEHEKFIMENFVYDGEDENNEFYSRPNGEFVYHLSKNKNENFVFGISLRRISPENKRISIKIMVYTNLKDKRIIKEKEPLKLLERIMKHHPHRDIYEREMKLKAKDKLEIELKAKDTVKPKRMKI